ncbi:ribonucleotide-diphosphate reductase subunit beta [Paenibacillus sp. EKM202P]|uniref:ribonucleotide-diphosphate reductase subunit beta n=1 Tax=unclassified Paenibacillus TaxID=185978 RepID=UPI0013EC51F2|nr:MULTISPECIES: ribonucleotide-diphosphate reductase subunit beta [unclassified Paenibacillus]KAF6565296.1 ribonucleotide-diphosphate reductase subunit beta [Paenibacillus sp. EKM202P]KAF6569378.1 ribonucleotide-diphosphate reductase subunit beta [Paenibacillus sp. EKM207P]
MAFRVFNGEVNNKATKIFGGEASGICDWDDIKYPHMLTLYKELFGNYWIEDEIRLTSDLKQYRDGLTEKERYTYNVVTGMLTSLDSVANRFNFTIGHTCTDPSVAAVIQIIGAFEGLHARSYQYLTSTMLNSEQKKQAFNAPKEIPLLRKRNDIIFEKIQNFIDDPTNLEKLYHALLANLVLEGVFFTGAFVYFNSLARSNRMIGSNNMVNLIKTDENFHSVFYGDVMKILMLENPELNTELNHKEAVSFIKTCVEKEKEWAEFIFEGIDTLSILEYKDYVEYLANVICRNAGIQEVYPDNKELKSKWIITYGSKGGNTKSDFFQTNVISYGHESGDGFDL